MGARFFAYVRAGCAAHPWMLPGVALTGSAALGTHLSALIRIARAVWS